MKLCKLMMAGMALFSFTSMVYAEQWVHLKSTETSDILVNIDQVREVEIEQKPFKQTWIKTIKLQDSLADDMVKGDYTQALWRFDCQQATSSILSYVDYRKNGDIINSGMFEYAQQQIVLPDSIEENALLAVCDGRYPQKSMKQVVTEKVNVVKQEMKETTQKVTTTANKAKTAVENSATKAKATATDSKNQVKDSAKQAKENVAKKVTDTKTAVSQKVEQAKKTANTANVSQKVAEAKTTVTQKATQAQKAVQKTAEKTVEKTTQKATQTKEAVKKVVSPATTKN
ncbi:hypothetical protein [Moraxella sp. ZY210820]|uniref:hypothetical protein n=1 Tax=unclassified Moraxella TaxID=2685852 RepID=UPI002731A576|nr:hypothetical protein [Moraxella sp. ZY210820]WLF83668.1 hypothetical protein LU301_10490 [Moraxella sp. ZY210820]